MSTVSLEKGFVAAEMYFDSSELQFIALKKKHQLNGNEPDDTKKQNKSKE